MQTWRASNSLPALPRRVAAIAPEQLSQRAQRAVAELLREGESANTLASYRGALRYWSAWYALRFGHDLAVPVPTAAVLQFVVDHLQRKGPGGLVHELPDAVDKALVSTGFKGHAGALSLATVEHRLSVLSKLHKLRDAANPVGEQPVRELMSRVRRAYARRGVRPKKQAPLTRDPLQAVLATCDRSMLGLRDQALLLFAWCTGGRRRSEVAAADMKDLRAGPQGSFVFDLRHSKTNQDGQARPENFKPVTGAAATALQDWLAAAKIEKGNIFRRVDKAGRVGPSLSAAAVHKIVKRRCTLAGVEGDFGAHSLRSGFVSEALRSGVSAAEAMQLTGHRDVASLAGYFGQGQSLSPAMAAVVNLTPSGGPPS